MSLELSPPPSLLAELPEETRAKLVGIGTEVSIPAGETLLVEGDVPDAFYILLDGTMEVTKHLEGTEVVLNTCAAGDLIGELAVLRKQPRSATVRALTPSRLARIEADAIESVLSEPGVATVLLTTVTRRLEELQEHLRQHDRMATLGTLTAGLLHELNNPAAAVARSVERITEVTAGIRAAMSDITDRTVLDRLEGMLGDADPPQSPIARLDAEEELAGRLAVLGIDDDGETAAPLAALGIAADDLETALGTLAELDRIGAVRWLARRGQLIRLVDEASLGAARISEIVGAVKRYSHVDEAPVQDIDIHEGLEAALTILRGRVPPGVEIVREYASPLPTVEGFPGDLNAVWTNLLDNALDAVDEGGTVTVRTGARGNHVEIEVQNTGPAIPDSVLERVFDPFFTTKPVGRGTGLGLATAYAVVARRHHGRLTLESEAGRTVATVVLPRQLPGASAQSSTHASTHASSHAQRRRSESD